MNRRRSVVIAVLGIAALGVGFYVVHARQEALVLTGIVTTNDVIVSPQISGQLSRLLVQEGDAVTAGQLLAVIAPEELRAESAYYEHTAAGAGSQVEGSAAEVRFQEQQMVDEVRQAEANVAAAVAQEAAARADLDNAQANLRRTQELARDNVVPAQQLDQARTSWEAAKARVDALHRQVEAQRAAVAVVRANAQQIAMRRSELQENEHQQAAADANRAKAGVRLAYTEIHAPIAGIVDVRAARPGEVLSPGQPIVTLVNPDDLWVRADVEESSIDHVRIGDRLTVRLPSGAERQGTVFFRGVDAGFATQRDVSRTKRDIKTFEIRLRVDNRDRRLAVGMTAYVLLPLASP